MIKKLFQKDPKTGQRNKRVISLVLVFFFIGWGIMFIIAVFEEDMNKAFSF
jgi:hypothetical protein